VDIKEEPRVDKEKLSKLMHTCCKTEELYKGWFIPRSIKIQSKKLSVSMEDQMQVKLNFIVQMSKLRDDKYYLSRFREGPDLVEASKLMKLVVSYFPESLVGVFVLIKSQLFENIWFRVKILRHKRFQVF
jgi:hypothetical protein